MQHDRNYVRWMVLYIYICAHHLHMGNSHMYICTCNCTHEIRLHHHACTCRHAQNKTVYHVCVLYNKISYANTTSNFCWILGRKGAKRGNDAKQKMVKPKSSSRIGFTNYSCSQCSPGTQLYDPVTPQEALSGPNIAFWGLRKISTAEQFRIRNSLFK